MMSVTSIRKLLLKSQNHHLWKQRWFSTANDELQFIQQHYVVQRHGDPGYSSHEYLLLAPDATLDAYKEDHTISAAILRAHRNILFGAESRYPLKDICSPLVTRALDDAGINGEQPQAIASLAGLCDWIQSCLESEESTELKALQANDAKAFEAVKAIATGIPRPGHSVVGVGTYRDAESGWKKIAREFADLGLSEEAELYRQHGGQLVNIEILADQNPDYLQTAGGSMARLFFV